METRQGVLAVAECDATGALTSSSLEMLGAARSLANGLACELAAVLAADGAPAIGELAARGVRRVFSSSPVGQGADRREVRLGLARAAVQAMSPAVVIFPAAQGGQEAAARVAAWLGCELVSGCTRLTVQNGEVRFARPCLGGQALAQLLWNSGDSVEPVVVTVAAGAFSAPQASENAAVEITRLDIAATVMHDQVEQLAAVAPSPEELGVTESDVLVAGGLGVGGPAGFALLTELARKLGGTIAASRAAVDRGWVPYERQVGQTGKSVAPRLYLAFGISGAPQHIAGIRSAGRVVAINRDPRAPIFQVADLAVLADLEEVVPRLLARLPETAAAASVEGR
jgi:electron transfer flavoprotein alpha subunit